MLVKTMTTKSSPIAIGEGDREAVEGASASSEPSPSPSTTLRVVPLPRIAGEDQIRRSPT